MKSIILSALLIASAGTGCVAYVQQPDLVRVRVAVPQTIVISSRPIVRVHHQRSRVVRHHQRSRVVRHHHRARQSRNVRVHRDHRHLHRHRHSHRHHHPRR